MTWEERFRQAKVPKVRSLRGDYAVSLVVPVLEGIRFFGHTKHFPADAAKGGGYNCFLGRIRIGPFRVARGKSVLGDGLEVLKIIYGPADNPLLLHRLSDEVREERPGFYFCRGILALFGRQAKIMYFTLEKLAG
jgi:hypothetical protein